jgi:hypothetical protein
MESADKNTQLFVYLVGSFELSAMQFMGKIKNPVTDKIEKNLEQAQFSIDMLDMLKIKTKGNLQNYEEKLLDNVLGQLKMNYVDEAEKDKQQTNKEQNSSSKNTGNTEEEKIN